MSQVVVGLRPGNYVDERDVVKRWLKNIAVDLVLKDRDCHIINTGEEGSGKSTFAYLAARQLGRMINNLIRLTCADPETAARVLCRYWNDPLTKPTIEQARSIVDERAEQFHDTIDEPRFTPENFAWTTTWLERLAHERPKASVLVLDEGTAGLFNRDAGTTENKDWVKKTIVMRVLNHAVFYCIPEKESADKYIRDSRVRYFSHVPRRGLVEVAIRHKDKHQTTPYFEDFVLAPYPRATGPGWQRILELKEEYVASEGMGKRSEYDGRDTPDLHTFDAVDDHDEAVAKLRLAWKILIEDFDQYEPPEPGTRQAKGMKELPALRKAYERSRQTYRERQDSPPDHVREVLQT